MTALTWPANQGGLWPTSGVGSEAAVRGLPEENLALPFLSGCFQNNSPTRPCPLRSHDGCKPFGGLLIGNLPFELLGWRSGPRPLRTCGEYSDSVSNAPVTCRSPDRRPRGAIHRGAFSTSGDPESTRPLGLRSHASGAPAALPPCLWGARQAVDCSRRGYRERRSERGLQRKRQTRFQIGFWKAVACPSILLHCGAGAPCDVSSATCPPGYGEPARVPTPPQ